MCGHNNRDSELINVKGVVVSNIGMRDGKKLSMKEKVYSH